MRTAKPHRLLDSNAGPLIAARDGALPELSPQAPPRCTQRLFLPTNDGTLVALDVEDGKPCEDFETFRPLFERVQAEVKTGMRQSQPIEAGRRAIEAGDFFVLDGLTLYVAEVGEPLQLPVRERRLVVGVVEDAAVGRDQPGRAVDPALGHDSSNRPRRDP